MLYVLFMLIFFMMLGISLVVQKQNAFFQKQGLKVIGRVIAIEERTRKRRKGSGAPMTIMVPIIEYSHKSKTWQFESDENANIRQIKVGDIVDLVVHPEHPLVMSQDDLAQRHTLSFILLGLLIVPLVMCFGFYQFNDAASQLIMFEPLGLTVRHFEDIIAVIVMIKLTTQFFGRCGSVGRRSVTIHF